MVGQGIEDVFACKSLETIIWEAFIAWEPDLLESNPKQKKSFFEALAAITQFHAMRSNGYLEDYELASYNGKPATELGFIIHLEDGFKYRGFIDAVLQNVHTGEVLVLEAKTTSFNQVNPAQYKNSSQALGYSVVLDTMFPGAQSYEVLYLVYATKLAEFIELRFIKTLFDRALWLHELWLDIQTMKMYDEHGVYPLHGNSCMSYGRTCEFFDICTMSTERITKPLTQEMIDEIEADNASYDIQVQFNDLIDTQLENAE